MSHGAELEKLATMDDVLTRLGGTAAVMALTGIKTEQAVSEWKRRGVFAARYYLIMSQALARAGYEADPRLWGQAVAGSQQQGPGEDNAAGIQA